MSQSLAEWVIADFVSQPTGFRDMLEPILPRPKIEFSLLDAEIAQFIYEGQAEHARLQEIIDSIGKEPEQPSDNGFFYPAQESQIQMLNDVTIEHGNTFTPSVIVIQSVIDLVASPIKSTAVEIETIGIVSGDN